MIQLKSIISIAVILVNGTVIQARQQPIELYNGTAPGSENWNWDEKEFRDHNTTLLYDVSRPSIEVYFPPDSLRNGTSVIVCPGGGFCLLEIESEGRNIARWLNTKGITAFVLKYRVMKTQTDNPQKEMFAKAMNTQQLAIDADSVIQMGIGDIFTTMTKIKTDATRLKIDPEKIGVIGFSAGGTLATALAYNYDTDTKPAFVAAIYPWTAPIKKQVVQDSAPPLFIAAATDDQLGFNIGSAALYLDWVKHQRPAELHLYAKGGHGFVAFKSGGAVDSWNERFTDWLKTNRFIKE